MDFYRFNCHLFMHLLLINVATFSKLNVPRVLLPYNHHKPANFTLKVYDGSCYRWTSSREEVKIKEIVVDGCSNEAVVSAITKSSVKQTAIIIAKDVVSGLSLRCDVIIDSIHRLEIVTTTRELYVEEAPEEFEVRAYDEQGNEFSSLEGQEFTWEIETITEDTSFVIPGQSVLRFIKFKDSPYETPNAIAPLELKGAQGYMVLIEGKQTGVARVAVHLSHQAYEDLPHCSVDLMVVANLILEPSDVYILPQTSVEYSVFHLKQGIFHPVDIQGSQYSLKISEDVAEMKPDGITAFGLHQGSTSVILQDNNMKVSQALKQPTATLHVVHPSYLTISISPHNNPSLINDYEYVFLVHVYDANNNKIHLADNLIINSPLPSEYFETHFCSKNGTYLHGSPIKTGMTKIRAELTGIQQESQVLEISPPLEAYLDVTINEKIQVVPPLTILPWDPETKPTYDVLLTVKGGESGVTWTSDNPEIVRVLPTGKCKTVSHGSAMITVSLSANPQNSDTAEVHLIEALDLNWIDSIVEVELDTKLALPIVMATKYDENEALFSTCHSMPIKVAAVDSTFITLEEIHKKEIEESCASIEVIGKKIGFSKIVASYASSARVLSAKRTVAAYHVLRPIFPSSGETVLALGSSTTILFEGGPLPWINNPTGHFVKVSSNDTEKCSFELISQSSSSKLQPDVQAVQVSCLELGHVRLTLIVGNKPSASLPFPKEVSASVIVTCAMPDSAVLQPLSEPMSSHDSSCPASSKLGATIVHCRRPLPLELSVFDLSGRKFDNISSLSLEWGLSDMSLASIPSAESSLTTSEIHGYEIPVIVQVLEPKGLTGELVVTVTILGFKPASLLHLSMRPLQASAPLRLADDAILSPPKLVLYNHRDNEADIVVSGGSGFFKMSQPKGSVFKASFLQQEKRILVKPVSDGSSTISLTDLCLESYSTATSNIRVSSIVSLDLSVLDRVELKKSLKAEVSAKDSEGRYIPAHSLMDFEPQPQSDIINVQFDSINENGNAVYNITGQKVGDTTLRVSARKGRSPDDPIIYSQSRPIQVFPPLTLLPKNITLIVGATYQAETKGGPYPDAKIEFLTKEESIANTSHSGVITAITIGTTEITARSVSHMDGETLTVYSQDSVTVTVVPLSSLFIHSPLKHLEMGTTMPLYAMGNEQLTPLSFITAIPPLIFKWSIDNQQVAAIQSVYGKNGINTVGDTEGIVRFVALKPGRVTISLKVSVRENGGVSNYQIFGNKILSDKLELKVFESLKLKSPEVKDASLLLSPNVDFKLQTNRDGDSKLTYTVECPGAQSETPLITISPNGVIKTGPSHGEATVCITITEPFGVKQTVNLLVEVRPVKYIQMDPEVFMSLDKPKSSSIRHIPQGASHRLMVTFHDERGRVFSATNSELCFRPSRFDLMIIEAGGLKSDIVIVTLRESGKTVLQVTDLKNPHVVDYLKMDVKNSILPHQVSLPLGSYILFSCNIRDTSGAPGRWESDTSALEIDPISGVARAFNIGKATISYRVNPGLILTSQAFVNPINELSCHPPPQVVSNSQGQKVHFAPVSYSGRGTNVAISSGLANHSSPFFYPFRCELYFAHTDASLDVTEYFSVEPSVHSQQGFGCSIAGKKNSDASFAATTTSLFLQVTVDESGEQERVVSDPTKILFYPALFYNRSEITLTDVDPSASIPFTGHQDLIQHLSVPEDESIPLSFYFETIDASNSKLVITAKDHLWTGSVPLETVYVTIQCLKNLQDIQVKVNLEQLGPGVCTDPGNQLGLIGLLSALVSHYQATLLSLFCIVVTAVCFLVGYRSLTDPGYKQTQQADVFAASRSPLHSYSPGGTTLKGRPLTGSLMCSPSISNGFNRSLHHPSQPQPSVPSTSSPTLNSSSSGVSLWTEDRQPFYGSPMFRSSPKPAYDGSPTYSSSAS